MKPLFITIDTEGDSLWDNPEVILTKNANYIPRFQELCEKYGFIPTWLTDYEMACDSFFINYIKSKVKNGLCEIGIHVHAKNNPPIVELEGEKSGAAYLIEYSNEDMRKKTVFLKNLLEDKLDIHIKTHRAGRWALNKKYIDLLIDEGIKYDCSVTPGINWSGYEGITPGSKGTDYSDSRCEYYRLTHSNGEQYLFEIPMTIMNCNHLLIPNKITARNCMRSLYHFVSKSPLWLRSRRNNLNEMKYLLKKVAYSELEYAEYMIHSSELMPGGSPTFADIAAIEQMYEELEEVFKFARNIGFYGSTFENALK